MEVNVLKDIHGIKISLPIELSILHIDWQVAWRRVRTKGMPSEYCSTLLMSLHDWLLTNQHIQSMRRIKDPRRQQCRFCGHGVESIFHVLVYCKGKEAARALLSWIGKLAPTATLFDIFYLQVDLTPGSKEETAVSLLTALTVHNIWLNRDSGVNAWGLKTEAIVFANMLMNMKYSSVAKVIHSLIQ